MAEDLDTIRIGISACLLGQEVRFDGGHKRDHFLTETFGRLVEWVPVCPEVEVGMGTPREAIRLVRGADSASSGSEAPVRLVGVKSGKDWTHSMRSWSAERLDQLATLDLCGYVLKKDSPSCGMERVKIYATPGMPDKSGVGLFAAALLARFPNLPVEEEGRLQDPRLRDNFVERVFAYRRLRTLFAGRWTAGDLVRFHTAHKLILLAHHPSAYTALGRLVATARQHPRAELRERYEREFMSALRRIATPKRHANVMQHMVGYFRTQLDADSRDELLALIEDHRTGLVPLIVPITLIKHHARRLSVEYLQGQVYLEPHPRELALRNHV
jgi:uncharacterized protein YbgA (DUF1722 family)/uncharacterized protein YbbK (DUF523 family)